MTLLAAFLAGVLVGWSSWIVAGRVLRMRPVYIDLVRPEPPHPLPFSPRPGPTLPRVH